MSSHIEIQESDTKFIDGLGLTAIIQLDEQRKYPRVGESAFVCDRKFQIVATNISLLADTKQIKLVLRPNYEHGHGKTTELGKRDS